MGFFEDESGKWSKIGKSEILVEPSENFLQKKENERFIYDSELLIESMQPSVDDIRKAEIEVVTVNTLIDLGVI